MDPPPPEPAPPASTADVTSGASDVIMEALRLLMLGGRLGQ